MNLSTISTEERWSMWGFFFSFFLGVTFFSFVADMSLVLDLNSSFWMLFLDHKQSIWLPKCLTKADHFNVTTWKSFYVHVYYSIVYKRLLSW